MLPGLSWLNIFLPYPFAITRICGAPVFAFQGIESRIQSVKYLVEYELTRFEKVESRNWKIKVDVEKNICLGLLFMRLKQVLIFKLICRKIYRVKMLRIKLRSICKMSIILLHIVTYVIYMKL